MSDVSEKIAKEIKKHLEIKRKSVLFYTPQMWYAELLICIPDNPAFLYEFHIIKEAGLLPKLKYVNAFAERGTATTTSVNYVFDNTLTWQEFQKVAIIEDKTKFLTSMHDKLMMQLEVWYKKKCADSPNDYFTISNTDGIDIIDPQDIVNVKSVKRDLNTNIWGLTDDVPDKDLITELELMFVDKNENAVVN